MTTETMPAPPKRRIYLTVLVLFGLVAVVFAGSIYRTLNASPDLAAELEQRDTLYFDSAREVPVVDLISHQGEPFSTSGFAGQWHVINFGYTFCPDICPTNMTDMAQAYRTLSEQGLADQVRMWMVTVDPARDTPQVLAEYVPFFHPEFTGLTGDVAELQTLAQQLNTLFYPEGEGEVYTVAHSDNIAIINPEGEYRALLRPPHSPRQIAEVMALLVEYD
ncbi:MAG TPA: SCO family protein [Saccharospirillum sp.]|nr:SCO family protein [Saccharospirillum sp.]